jgi:hypothetical protein
MRARGIICAVAAAVAAGALVPATGTAAGNKEALTPLLMDVADAPVPFLGSDGRRHLVYELRLTNFSRGATTVRRVVVLNGAGRTIARMNARAVARRLQPDGLRTATRTMAPSTGALLFVHVTLPRGARVPARIRHRVTAVVSAAPPGSRTIVTTGDLTRVDRRPVAAIGPPLRGAGYLSADSCCDATRHTRAALPVNGRVWVTQRFAVDWERIDAGNRIYRGPRGDVNSYAIYGDDVLAVANAPVVSVITGQPDQTPGVFPTNIPVSLADGNSVVLGLGKGRYALYAHLKPGSIRVRPGDRVSRGQVIGSVGNTGNSVAPHLHFHVMDNPSPLAANGLPYEIRDFRVVGRTRGTAAFDAAEADGTPLEILPSGARRVPRGLPLDQLLVDFGS